MDIHTPFAALAISCVHLWAHVVAACCIAAVSMYSLSGGMSVSLSRAAARVRLYAPVMFRRHLF
jgi:hypothetical protein